MDGISTYVTRSEHAPGDINFIVAMSRYLAEIEMDVIRHPKSGLGLLLVMAVLMPTLKALVPLMTVERNLSALSVQRHDTLSLSLLGSVM